MQERAVIVTNPDTKQEINVSRIIDTLPFYYSKSIKEFDEKIDLLNDCISYSDTLEKQVKYLNKMAFHLNDGIGYKFKEQLDKVSLYGLVKREKYSPIGKKYKDLYLKQSLQKGTSLLVPEFDRLTGGIQQGTLCTIAGAPGCMKTTYAVNIAYQALKDGRNVCYITLEETPSALYSKLLSRVSVDINKKLSSQNITQKNLEENDINCLFEEVQPFLEQLPGKLHIIGEQDLPDYELTSIENRLKEVDKYIKEQRGDDEGIDLLIVDHIQLLKFAIGSDDEYKLLNKYVNFFRKMALSFLNKGREISVIILSQVNREGMAYAQKHNGMYLMQHLGEASEIERASSYIITTYADPMTQVSKLLKVGAIKLRGAQLPMDTIQVFADGAYYQIRETSIPNKQDYSANDILENNDNSSSNNDYLEGLGLSL